MLIPIRCFTCGSVISAKWEEYRDRVKSGESPKKVLDDLKIKRYCCRSMMISTIDFMEDISTVSAH